MTVIATDKTGTLTENKMNIARHYAQDEQFLYTLGALMANVTKLSGGQLRRVFLAGTLAQQPDIILLDEPTNHLDLKYQIELIEYLKKWSSEGSRAVVGVLHDVNLAMRLSDNLMVMKDGEIKAWGKTGEVVTDSLLENVYEIDVAGYMRESLKRWEVIKNDGCR